MAREGTVWDTVGTADLIEAIMRHILQHDGLHGEHIGKLHLGDVEGTHHVGPAWESIGASLRDGEPNTPSLPFPGCRLSPFSQPSHLTPMPARERKPSLHPTHSCLPRPVQGDLLTSGAQGPPHLHCQSSSMPRLCVGTAHTSANARGTGSWGIC